MERIKKALDKAQKQRENHTNEPNPIVHKPEKQAIAYSQTRNIDVSDEWLKEKRIVAGSDDDPRSDLYKILRTKVLQKMRFKNSNLLAVTSPAGGAGKSVTALNLAISIAMDANYSVLLVDLDLRRPHIHEYLGIPVEPGLSDYLSGEKTIPELLVHPGLEKMVVLPAGSPVKRSSYLLSTPKMLELINELKQRYSDRVIIIDLPPLLQTDDAMILMPNVDACVLVVAEGESTDEHIQNCINLIGKEKYLGTILNKSTEDNVINDTAY